MFVCMSMCVVCVYIYACMHACTCDSIYVCMYVSAYTRIQFIVWSGVIEGVKQGSGGAP